MTSGGNIFNIFLRTNWPNFVYHKVTFIIQADLPECCSISVPAVINDIYRSAVPPQKYLPERRSAAFRHHYTPDGRLKSLRHMSRNAIGPRDNVKVPKYSAVVSEESPRHPGPTYKSSSSDCKLLKIFEDMHSAECRHSMIITITLRVNCDGGAKELFGYESDRRRNLLICMNCLRKSFVFQLPRQSAPVERIFSTSELFMQPQYAACSQGQQLQVNW